MSESSCKCGHGWFDHGPNGCDGAVENTPSQPSLNCSCQFRSLVHAKCVDDRHPYWTDTGPHSGRCACGAVRDYPAGGFADMGTLMDKCLNCGEEVICRDGVWRHVADGGWRRTCDFYRGVYAEPENSGAAS